MEIAYVGSAASFPGWKAKAQSASRYPAPIQVLMHLLGYRPEVVLLLHLLPTLPWSHLYVHRNRLGTVCNQSPAYISFPVRVSTYIHS